MAFFIRLLVAVELFRTVRPVFDELDQHNGLIPYLIKCCSDQEFYLVGFVFECKDVDDSSQSVRLLARISTAKRRPIFT